MVGLGYGYSPATSGWPLGCRRLFTRGQRHRHAGARHLPAGWLADGHPSPADSDVLIRWDDGSVTTHGQARELAEWMRKTRKQRPAAAQSAKPTKQSNNAAWWEKHERKRRLRAAIAEHNRKPKQPRYLP